MLIIHQYVKNFINIRETCKGEFMEKYEINKVLEEAEQRIKDLWGSL